MNPGDLHDLDVAEDEKLGALVRRIPEISGVHKKPRILVLCNSHLDVFCICWNDHSTALEHESSQSSDFGQIQ